MCGRLSHLGLCQCTLWCSQNYLTWMHGSHTPYAWQHCKLRVFLLIETSQWELSRHFRQGVKTPPKDTVFSLQLNHSENRFNGPGALLWVPALALEAGLAFQILATAAWPYDDRDEAKTKSNGREKGAICSKTKTRTKIAILTIAIRTTKWKVASETTMSCNVWTLFRSQSNQ